MSDVTVDFNNGTVPQVALEMMKYIRHSNRTEYQSEQDIIKLYRKCYKAANGQYLESILEED